MIHGTLAAAVTPLAPGGDAVDEPAIPALVNFYAASGLDGLLVLGTTGEGVLLSVVERQAVAAAFLACARDRLAIAVHCGAQSTRDTVALAAHAADHGAAAVAVIPPPYYALDDRSLLAHLVAAAAACPTVPFFVYEFAARSGYAVPLPVLDQLRSVAPNLAGLKVSDSPFERLDPYLREGFDVFVGAEALIHRGLGRGAAGSVSGLAAAFPELTLRAVNTGSAEASAHAGRVRDVLQQFPFPAVLKLILQRRGIAISDSVRAPLRTLIDAERADLERIIGDPDGELAPLLAGAAGR